MRVIVYWGDSTVLQQWDFFMHILGPKAKTNGCKAMHEQCPTRTAEIEDADFAIEDLTLDQTAVQYVSKSGKTVSRVQVEFAWVSGELCDIPVKVYFVGARKTNIPVKFAADIIDQISKGQGNDSLADLRSPWAFIAGGSGMHHLKLAPLRPSVLPAAQTDWVNRQEYVSSGLEGAAKFFPANTHFYYFTVHAVCESALEPELRPLVAKYKNGHGVCDWPPECQKATLTQY